MKPGLSKPKKTIYLFLAETIFEYFFFFTLSKCKQKSSTNYEIHYDTWMLPYVGNAEKLFTPKRSLEKNKNVMLKIVN